MKLLTWTTERRKLSDLMDWPKNPRQLSKHDADHLRRSIHKFGLADPLVINLDGLIIGGHQRKRIMLMMEAFGDNALVDVRIPSRLLTDEEVTELNVRLNRNTGEFDFDKLANEFSVDDLLEWGFTEWNLGIQSEEDLKELWKGMPEFDQGDLSPYRTIAVHFDAQEDVESFSRLVGQTITDKTRYINYPYRQPAALKELVYSDES